MTCEDVRGCLVSPSLCNDLRGSLRTCDDVRGSEPTVWYVNSCRIFNDSTSNEFLWEIANRMIWANVKVKRGASRKRQVFRQGHCEILTRCEIVRICENHVAIPEHLKSYKRACKTALSSPCKFVLRCS